jgi:hypothetical protein
VTERFVTSAGVTLRGDVDLEATIATIPVRSVLRLP